LAAFKESVDESSLPAAKKAQLKTDADSGKLHLDTHVNGATTTFEGLSEPAKASTGSTYPDDDGDWHVSVEADWVDMPVGDANSPHAPATRKRWLKKLYRHEIDHLPGTGPGGVGRVADDSCEHVGLILVDMEEYCAESAQVADSGNLKKAGNLCGYARAARDYAEDIRASTSSGCPEGVPGSPGLPNFGWQPQDLEICPWCKK
jgi:hypothetical protein